MAKYKAPSPADAARCMAIRCASKSGRQSNSEEHKFCCVMFKKYPKWYSATEHEVFERTIPFGAR